MSKLSGIVRRELRRYSDALNQTLLDIEQRGPIRTIDDFTDIFSEVHALFDDDFLDRLEPSGWIQPLLELSLVPQSAKLIALILQAYEQAKNAGLFAAPAVSGSPRPPNHVPRQLWGQLAAIEIGQAAFPIQSAVQAIQIEIASTPAPQRQGGRLLEELAARNVLQVLANAARFVTGELWTPANDPSTAAPPLPTTMSAPEAIGRVAESDMDAIMPKARRRKSILEGFRRRIDHVLGESGCGSGAAGAAAGARVLSFIAHHLSALLAAFEEEAGSSAHHYTHSISTAGFSPGGASATGGAGWPAAAQLLASVRDSDVLTALCAGVLAAPLAPPDAAAAYLADDYPATLADMQLAACMALWDLSALVAPYGDAVGELLEAPPVLQLRLAALEQVAASAAWRAEPLGPADSIKPSYTRNTHTGGGGGGVGGSSNGGFSSRGGSAAASAAVAAAATATPRWALLQCPALRRVYAARGLQLPDVVHILVDAAVGAVNLAQDHGTRAAAAAAEQLFPCRAAAADLAVRVCRALYCHAAEEPGLSSSRTGRGDGSSPWASPYISAGGGGTSSRAGSRGGGGVGGSRVVSRGGGSVVSGGGGGLPPPQRAQLADDAASVEVALRIRLIGAPPEELTACMPAVVGVRSWVQRLSVAAFGGPAAAAAAAAGSARSGLVLLELDNGDSPSAVSASDLSSLSSPDGLAVYTARSPRYPEHGHDDFQNSPVDSLQCSSPSITDGLDVNAAAAAAAAAVTRAGAVTTAANAVATQAGSRSRTGAGTRVPECEPSVTGSKSSSTGGSRFFSRRRRASTSAGAPLTVPQASPSPAQSPVRQPRQPHGGGLRGSLDRLRRWVSTRRSHEELRTASSADVEAEIVLPPRAQTPGRGVDGGSGGGKSRQAPPTPPPARGPSALIEPEAAQPMRHSHSGAPLAPREQHPPDKHLQLHQQQQQQPPSYHPPYSASPLTSPQKPVVRSYLGTPPRALPPRHGSGAPGTPPRAPPSSGGGGVPHSLVAAPSSTRTQDPEIAAARGVVGSSPGTVQSAGGGPFGSTTTATATSCGGGGGGIGRFASSGGRSAPEGRGLRSPVFSPDRAMSESPAPPAAAGGGLPATGSGSKERRGDGGGGAAAVPAPAVGGGNGRVNEPQLASAATTTAAAAAAAKRRSVLRSGVLATPLRLWRRHPPRAPTEEGGK